MKPHASVHSAGKNVSAAQPNQCLIQLYDLVAAGEETRIVLEKSKAPDYKQKLADELKEMGNSEMWRAGTAVRSLRPSKPKKE